jgi:MoaA/NifB/PqqE/SkfB family radical SAM enzyme
MVTGLWLQIEVTGSPTVCRHCWAQGVGAAALFADHVGAAEFEPLSTTGVPLAVREDWRELLAAAAELGTTTVWMAFHDVGIEHDRQVNCPGAWAETCLAVQRVHAAGLRAGANMFLTTANIPQVERLLGVLQRLQLDGMVWEPAIYYPNAAGPPQRAAAPTAYGASAVRRPNVPGQQLGCRSLGGPCVAHRGGLGDPCAGRRVADGARHDGEVIELVAAPTWTCTPAWRAGTSSGTATCGPRSVGGARPRARAGWTLL